VLLQFSGLMLVLRPVPASLLELIANRLYSRKFPVDASSLSPRRHPGGGPQSVPSKDGRPADRDCDGVVAVAPDTHIRSNEMKPTLE